MYRAFPAMKQDVKMFLRRVARVVAGYVGKKQAKTRMRRRTS